MQINLKKLNKNAVIPVQTLGNAGMDLTAISRHFDEFGNIVYDTGIAIEIPEGYVGLLYPRSSISKKALSLANAVGVIDSSYRGSIILKFKPTLAVCNYEGGLNETINPDDIIGVPAFEHEFHQKDPVSADKRFSIDKGDLLYEVGDRVGQLIIIPYPTVTFKEVEELSTTERGSGAFGSTGK